MGKLIYAERLEGLLDDIEQGNAAYQSDYANGCRFVAAYISEAIQSGRLDAPAAAKCFWSTGCSDSSRCRAFGSCVAAHQNKHKHEISRPAAAEVNADGLLPCPFCGCTDIDPRMGLSGNGEISAGCWNCGACSGGKKTEKESIAAWNTRAAGGGGE